MSDKSVTPVPTYDDDALGSIMSFQDALDMLTASNATLVDSQDFGSGFVVTEKASLVETPFVILTMKIHDGGTYGEFAILHIVTEDGRKCIVNDGSTGICKQVRETYLAKGINGGVMVKGGLSRSDYTYKDEKGNDIPATTYYLN